MFWILKRTGSLSRFVCVHVPKAYVLVDQKYFVKQSSVLGLTSINIVLLRANITQAWASMCIFESDYDRCYLWHKIASYMSIQILAERVKFYQLPGYIFSWFLSLMRTRYVARMLYLVNSLYAG